MAVLVTIFYFPCGRLSSLCVSLLSSSVGKREGYLGGAEDYFYHNVSQFGCSGLDFMNASGGGYQAAKGFAGTYSAGIIGSAAAALLRTTPLPTPLYLYIAFQSVHSPVQAPESLIERYQGRPRPKFMAMVRALDDAIGVIGQALHDSGRYNNSVWIVTTDNGGCFWSFGSNW